MVGHGGMGWLLGMLPSSRSATGSTAATPISDNNALSRKATMEPVQSTEAPVYGRSKFGDHPGALTRQGQDRPLDHPSQPR